MPLAKNLMCAAAFLALMPLTYATEIKPATVSKIWINGVERQVGESIVLVGETAITWQVSLYADEILSGRRASLSANNVYVSLCKSASDCDLVEAAKAEGASYIDNGVRLGRYTQKTMTVSSGTYSLYYSDFETNYMGGTEKPGTQQINAEVPSALTFTVIESAEASYTASVTGTRAGSTITTRVKPATDSYGVTGNIYVGANVPDLGWFFLDENGGWTTELVAAKSNVQYTTDTVEIDVVSGFDLSDPVFDNVELYAGYGTSIDDLVVKNTYKMIHKVAR